MPHRKAVENKSAPGNLCTIGKVARAAAERSGLRCTPTMIYNYERLGLMSPPKKTEGGTRLYDDQDLDRLVLLKKLQREFGGSLDEIKVILTEIERGIRSGEFHCRDARGAAFEIISLVELFRYRSIHRERFVFEKFGQALEGSREGRHMELLRIVVDEILNPAVRPGPAVDPTSVPCRPWPTGVSDGENGPTAPRRAPC